MRAAAPLIHILFTAVAALAQQPPGCAVITVPLVALAPGGNTVRGLEAKHLRAATGRGAVEIESVVQHTAATRVLLLIEGSVLHSNEKWPPVRQVMTDMVRFARADTILALATFTDRLEVHVGFGASREHVLQALGDLPARAPRNAPGHVVDNLHQALETFGAPATGDVVYLATDGDHSQSRMRTSDVTEELLRAGLRLFAIYFREQQIPGGFGVVVSGPLLQNPGIEPWSPGERDPAGIGGIVWDSGGAVINLLPKVASMRFDVTGKRLEDLQRLAAMNYRAMTQFYEVKVKTAPRSALLDFDIDLAQERGPLSSLRLLQPRKLPPCTP